MTHDWMSGPIKFLSSAPVRLVIWTLFGKLQMLCCVEHFISGLYTWDVCLISFCTDQEVNFSKWKSINVVEVLFSESFHVTEFE